MSDHIVTFKCQWDPSPASPNRTRGKHWSHIQGIRDAAHAVAMAAWSGTSRPENVGPVVVDLECWLDRTMDEDNIWAGMKHLRDWWFTDKPGFGRLTPDDSPKWVKLGTITQHIDRSYRGREWVAVHVRKREP